MRRGDVYREESESRAFPGWRVGEIYRALTESPLSGTAWRALERVALAMGAREGTKPEDDPLMGPQKAKARTEGHTEGHREGHAEGHREGHAQGHQEGHAQGHREGLVQGRSEMLAANVLTVLRARGIDSALDATADRELLGGLSSEAVLAAALACTDAADFRRRVGKQHAAPGATGRSPLPDIGRVTRH